MPRKINPKLTEQYLLGLEDVVDASVWWHDGNLCACVTVLDSSVVESRDFQVQCMETLGLHQTPRNIMLTEVKPKGDYASGSFSASSSGSSSVRVVSSGRAAAA